jgi:hypothetical protein
MCGDYGAPLTQERLDEITDAKDQPHHWFRDVTFEEWDKIALAMKETHKMSRYINQKEPSMTSRILYVKEGEEPPEPECEPLSAERLAEVEAARQKGEYVGFCKLESNEVEWILHLMRDWDFDGDSHGINVKDYSMFFTPPGYEPGNDEEDEEDE